MLESAADTNVGEERSSDAVTGAVRFVEVPSPSWLRLLLPQHVTVLLLSIAQEWLLPAFIATALLIPATATGEDRSVVLLSPSWPELLLPQHLTVPSASMAHEWYSPEAEPPAEIAVTFGRGVDTAEDVLTSTGELLLSYSFPLPSWPR